MRRSKFNLSHYRLLTGSMGELIPCGLVEVLPGDTFQHSTSSLLRVTPMAAPVMHQVDIRVHHWFVPHRLVWDAWDDFITGGPDGLDATAVPTVNPTRNEGDLLDHYGVPPTAHTINALPVYGFNAIYNQFYRDQDLVPERNNYQSGALPKIAWEKDYFTTARPWPQKGDEVTLPLGTSADVHVEGSGSPAYVTVEDDTSGNTTRLFADATSGDHVASSGATLSGGKMYADLSSATAATVNQLRRAMALQRFAEARARYGSRYVEYLRYLGVTPDDGRLDQPDYLGGGRVRLAISEVLQMAPETGTAPSNGLGVGDLYGHGIGAMRSRPYRRFFKEHGYVHSLLSVRPKTIYQNGIPRHWLRRYREEFWQKELQFIGQQEVWKSEIYRDSANTYDTWGYQDRYHEYREQPSQVAGEFRSTLDYWHLARNFASAPSLNETFVTCDPSKRIYNEQTMDSLWCMVNHRIAARRMVAGSAAGRIV